MSNIFSRHFEKFLTGRHITIAFLAKPTKLRLAIEFILLSEAQMGLDFRYSGDGVIVKLSGELDEYASRSLKSDIDRLIEGRGFKRMIFDMKNVTFMDSTGLGFVLGRYKKLLGVRAELLLKNVPPQVDRVLRTSGIYTFVPIVD